jgi:hypothetical protein
MGRQVIARASATLERLDKQAVTLERLEILEQKARRLADAGVTYNAIAARRNESNVHAGEGIHHDFNDALELLYDETFGGAPTLKEER